MLSTSFFNIWWITGRLADTVTKFSAESMSVKSESVQRAASSNSKTSTSCHVGTRRRYLRSSWRILWIAFCCSRIHETVFCIELHLIWQSVTRLCSGSFSSLWASFKSCFLLQLWENMDTSFLPTPNALVIRVPFFIKFSTARFRLWPKQEAWSTLGDYWQH